MGSGTNPAFQSSYHYSGPPLLPARGPSPTQESSFSSSMNQNKPTLMTQQYGGYGSSHGHSHEGQGHGHSHEGHGHSHGHKSNW